MDTQTRQRLLDLAYDLLPEAEAATLRARIAEDAELAEAFHGVQAEAALFAEAARFAAPKIALRPPEKAAETDAQAGKTPARQRSPWARAANWVVGVAAGLLLAVSLGGYWYHREQLAGLAADHLRLVVTGPTTLHPGVPAQYTVSTTSVTGTAMPSQVELAIYDGNKRLWKRSEKTEEDGRLQVVIPADHKIPAGARLEVLAVHQDKLKQVLTQLNVEPVGYMAHLQTDRPLYRPGETVRFRAVVLSQFGLAAAEKFPVQFEIRDEKGNVAGAVQSTAKTDRGVAGGTLTIPEQLADGRYALVACSPTQAFAEVQRPLLVRNDEPPAADGDAPANKAAAKSSLPGDGRLAVTFYPEGGVLAAGLENRVFFEARTADGKPADIRGTILDRSGTEVVAVETTHAGMGSFNFAPAGGEQYRLKIGSPAGIKSEFLLPPASRDAKVVLTATGVFDAGKPLECQVRAAVPNLPVVVAAYCGNLQIAQQLLVTTTQDAKAGRSNPVTIPLPEHVGGAIRLIAYDYSENPPKPLAERLVFRRTPQQLNLRITGLKERYAPGERVELRVAVTDESGKPAPAVLGVRAGDEALATVIEDRAPQLPADFLLTAALDRADEIARPEFYLGEGEEATAALDLLLGTHAGQPSALPATRHRGVPPNRSEPSQRPASAGVPPTPPAMFDNLKDIRAKYDEGLADYRARRSGILNALTAVSFFAGLGLVVLVVLLGLLRIVWGLHLWVPAVGVTVCCLIIGTILMDPSRGRSPRGGAVAFAGFEASEVEPHKDVPPDEKPPNGSPRKEVVGAPVPAAATLENRGLGAAALKAPPEPAAMMWKGAPPGRALSPGPTKGGARMTPMIAESNDAAPPLAPKAAVGRGGGVEKAAGAPAFEPVWRPLLTTDADGSARLSFTLPPSGGNFRLLIEAHGKGRVGAAAAKIAVRGPLQVRIVPPADRGNGSPAPDAQCGVRLAAALSQPRVKAGKTVTLDVEITNVTDENRQSVAVVVGIPGGLQLREEQLAPLRESGLVASCELRAQEVLCVWRELVPGQQVSLQLDLTAAVPGKHTGPASQVYLLSSPGLRQWLEPLAVEIAPE
jgi:hypothetical protein